MKRYSIERYSPSRKKWIKFGESFESKAAAEDRLVTLAYRHRREPDMKFRAVETDFDPELANKEAALQEKKSIKAVLTDKIKELKKDPKKEEIKSLTKQLKEVVVEEKELTEELKEDET